MTPEIEKTTRAAAIALGISSQCLLLAPPVGLAATVAISTLGAAVAAYSTARSTQLALATASWGGAGMALAARLESMNADHKMHMAHTAHVHVADHAAHAAGLLAWGLMLTGCVAGCALVCRRLDESPARNLAAHASAAAGMIAGMLLAPLLVQATGLSASGAHAAMVASMAAGASLGGTLTLTLSKERRPGAFHPRRTKDEKEQPWPTRART